MKVSDLINLLKDVNGDLELSICVSDGNDNYDFTDIGLNVQESYGCVELEVSDDSLEIKHLED